MKADGTINRAALPAIFNPEDLNALEQALRLKDAYPGTTVTLLTMGPGRAAEIIREGLYRGADGGFLLTDRAFAGADTLATSYALATAIKKINDYDIIIGGRQFLFTHGVFVLLYQLRVAGTAGSGGAVHGDNDRKRTFHGLDTPVELATAIKKINDYDIIIGGRQAIDGDTAQVGPQVAIPGSEESAYRPGDRRVARPVPVCQGKQDHLQRRPRSRGFDCRTVS